MGLLQWLDRQEQKRAMNRIRWKGQIYCGLCGKPLQPKVAERLTQVRYDTMIGVPLQPKKYTNFMVCQSDSSRPADYVADYGYARSDRLSGSQHDYWWNAG